jgi:hypothetical protein
MTETELIDAEAVRELIRTAAKEAGCSIWNLAIAWGVEPSTLYPILSGRRRAGPEILNHLGLRRVFRYERVGLSAPVAHVPRYRHRTDQQRPIDLSQQSDRRNRWTT